MNQFESTPLLTHLRREERDIYLRIDLDSTGQHGSGGVVRVLHLAGCENVDAVQRELEAGLAQLIWYEQEEENGLVLGLNFAADGVAVQCASWSEWEERVTESDLHVRCRWLAQCWHDSDNDRREMSRSYSKLLAALGRELTNASDRARRKEEFFRASGSERAEIYRAERNVYERIETILNMTTDDSRE